MTEKLEWSIDDAGEGVVVSLKGPVDEEADFAPLLQALSQKKRIRFDLATVGRINSCGVREWVNFMRTVSDQKEIEFEKCAPSVVSQINMISNFAGAARVLSVKAPFVCDACGTEEDVLVEVVGATVPDLENVSCNSCGQSMEFDDIEESYFSFML